LPQALGMAIFYSNDFNSSSSDEEVGKYEWRKYLFFVMYVCCYQFWKLFHFTWKGRGGPICGIGY
jgi:hypothetical protein